MSSVADQKRGGILDFEAAGEDRDVVYAGTDAPMPARLVRDELAQAGIALRTEAKIIDRELRSLPAQDRGCGLDQPFDCLRLKAFRRGEQDVEYMTLLARQKGWDREAVTHALASALDLSGETRRTDEEDAGALRFDRVADMQLDQMRLRVAAAVAKSNPAR